MSSSSNIKCPKCNRQVPKRTIMVTEGKCNNCGYRIAGTITRFAPTPKAAFDLLAPAQGGVKAEVSA